VYDHRCAVFFQERSAFAYLAGVEVVRPAGGMATFKRYLGGIAISEITGASVTRRYLFVDHLDSTDAITNESGDIANIYAPSFNPIRWDAGFADIPCGACRHIRNGLP
jgi:hypothetical protein